MRCMPEPATTSLDAALDAALRSRRSDHGGVPVGALLVPKRKLTSCRAALEAAVGDLRHGTRSDVRHALVVDRVTPDMFLLHVPATVAGVLDDPAAAPAELAAAVASAVGASGAVFYSGVRRCDALFGRALPPLAPRPGPPEAFTFAEVFAGIGGFRLGLEPLGGRCVFAAELDRAASRAYGAHWPAGGEPRAGDISSVHAADLPAFDLLTAGFPCQPFSDRGSKAGLLDLRGQLYRELVRLLSARQPAAFLFENVASLTEGRTPY
uniref:Cytosine-specific methyltransferase n=1 Tax=Emiliania huxleyi TaxID=2903 RepID=A0A6V2SFC8_EMIHU